MARASTLSVAKHAPIVLGTRVLGAVMIGKIFFLAMALAAVSQTATQQAALLRGNCLAAEHHQLDFWIGTWKVFQKSDSATQIATSHIESVMNGCGIRESYKSPNAPGGEYDGTSYSAFNRNDGKWHQFYVDVNGNASWYTGAMEGTDMVLTAPAKAGSLNKMTYHPLAGGVVEQIGMNSTDGGKTWAPGYDYIYRK
jgi:hypothetical protein